MYCCYFTAKFTILMKWQRFQMNKGLLITINTLYCLNWSHSITTLNKLDSYHYKITTANMFRSLTHAIMCLKQSAGQLAGFSLFEPILFFPFDSFFSSSIPDYIFFMLQVLHSFISIGFLLPDESQPFDAIYFTEKCLQA